MAARVSPNDPRNATSECLNILPAQGPIWYSGDCMRDEHRNRRAALEGLGKILDAGALEELFTGSEEEEASFLYDLLQDTTRGRASTYYWEICRTARSRGVSPEYVIDRAAVLLATMVERRRTDLYRILGVPPLSSNDTIRRRWLEIAKLHHPDVGGDGTVFRQAKQAYDVLSDATRRGDYERFWIRALGPFERVTPTERELPPPARPYVPEAPVATEKANGQEGLGMPGLEGLAEALREAARILEIGAALDRRLASGADGGEGIAGFLTRVYETLARIRREEIDALHADAVAAIERLEAERRVLAALASMRDRLPPVRLAS
jgi:curved DNA-binding protein CbpA